MLKEQVLGKDTVAKDKGGPEELTEENLSVLIEALENINNQLFKDTNITEIQKEQLIECKIMNN